MLLFSNQMSFDVLFIIFFTSIIQSIFGTGVLLFGTPALLLIGYNFEHTLLILLPTSIFINLFQIKNDYKDIDKNFYKNLILYSLPFIFLTLYFSQLAVFNANFLVGGFLIIISLQFTIKKINKMLKWLVNFEKSYLVIMGIIHGLTNLGGSLLTGAVLSKNLSKKRKRATIAISYFSMALIQIATLTTLINTKALFDAVYLIYWLSGLFIFFIIEKYFYHSVNEKMYAKYSSVFLNLRLVF